ncbi:hypothetical protein [Enterococcus gallinarum]|uniref:hypothetical protein n=1 Tax=Enterococcus gallinarum TaxID=1353 RepID=UPI0015C5336B|nr:hypothetical protein [Enterococcus gallinarum]NQE02081.1 hypothetical protein [Enterococcus gallinarum]
MDSVTSKLSNTWIINTHGENHTPEKSSYILDDVLTVFTLYVPIDKNRVMNILEDPSGPMYLNDRITILLKTAGSTYYAQNAYQMAHELCHFAAFYGIKNESFKWFEESICDLSSHFFLNELADFWKNSSDELKKSYSSNFISYDNLARKKIKKFDLKDLSNLNSETYTYLCEHKIDREMNTYVANKLFPIFRKTPDLWKAIPHLQFADADHDFMRFLRSWRDCSPAETQQGITKIIRHFAN